MNEGMLQPRPMQDVASSPSESLVDGLKRKKLRLESQLKDTTDALNALENNQEVTKLLELVLRTSRF